MSASRPKTTPGAKPGLLNSERRCHTRRSVIESRLVTVDLGSQKGVPILDLSESGLGVQAFAAVQPGIPCELRFDLPDVQGRIPPHARRVAGFAAMLKVQQLVREYRENRRAARRAAARIAVFFAGVLAVLAAVYLIDPTALHALLRALSWS